MHVKQLYRASSQLQSSCRADQFCNIDCGKQHCLRRADSMHTVEFCSNARTINTKSTGSYISRDEGRTSSCFLNAPDGVDVAGGEGAIAS